MTNITAVTSPYSRRSLASKIEYPSPLSTPSISAGTNTTHPIPKATLIPVKTCVCIAGSMIEIRVSMGVAPKLFASNFQRGSTDLTPEAVLMTIGHTDQIATKKYTGVSPIPNKMRAIGVQDRGDIIRKNCINTLLADSRGLLTPIAIPIGAPTKDAIRRPTNSL